ncbi:hypothetical protein Ocin01_08546 [Orchesella cincta]|uniref:Uncharacterized protein n=1 Tax=Orchesella cincta TaxID=48709 RepID=A0A1D2MYL1_ORCCI|nr:hypothetical protein Ocin01_08546 [Orchesella cincta]
MTYAKRIFLGTILFSLLVSVTHSWPAANLLNPDLEDYDLQSLQDDFDTHPIVSGIRSDVETTLNSKNETEKQSPFDTVVATEGQLKVLKATLDMDILVKLLEVHTQYIQMREKEDPSWPVTLARKVGSKQATREDELVFREDVHHVASAIVILKMMEERVSLFNQFVEDPNTDLSDVFKGSNSLNMEEGKLALQFLEAFLHSINKMIEEALKEGDSTSIVSSGGLKPLTPAERDDDVDFGLGAFILLLFSAIGFFFVLFTIVYSALKLVRKCFELTSSLEKKSKYEQI